MFFKVSVVFRPNLIADQWILRSLMPNLCLKKWSWTPVIYLLISKGKEAIQCSCASSMSDFWALLFGREIFKFKVGARNLPRH